jgi:isochorismate hydrolase
MMILTLKLNPAQAALLSHAIVEFQDNFHRLSHEDIFITEENISDLQNLVDQVLDQTNVEVYADVSSHVFQNEE